MNNDMKDEIKEILDLLKEDLYIPQEDNREYKLLEKGNDKLLLDYITNLQEENERLNNIMNELEKWLNDVPKYFMSKGSFNSGVSIQQGMQYQINLTKDKLKKLGWNK